MASRLVNVRLDETRLRKARRLRASGLSLTDVVREAIDVRYQALTGAATGRDAAEAVRQILETHPDPPDHTARKYDVHDGTAARRAIVARRKRRRA